jgi:PKD repeat protein
VAGALTGFDGTASADDGGTIVSYAWSFGDGLTGAGASPRHTYADGGSYPVTLTVTDDAGHSSSVTHQLTVGYAAPVAAFTDGPSSPVVGQTVSFDGTGSAVPAPGPVSYAWTFGDGAGGSGATTTHAFPGQGSYPATLTVTDAGGRTSSVTHVVTTQWGPTDLAVSVGGSIPQAGRYAYRVTVKNLGATAAHRVVLLNTLDPTQVLAAKASAPAGVTCAGVAPGATGTLTCTAGPSSSLAPGKSWVVTFTVKQPSAPRVRTVTETSRVSADNTDPVAANNSATRTTVLTVKR